MADWLGRKLGKVQIKDLIAHGGMAEIYTGIHDEHGLVAVKVMRGLLEHDPQQLARFQREAEVISGLRHPNIVRMLDYVVEEETPCLVMEYIPGPSLALYLKSLHSKDQRMPIATVARLLSAIASALDFAHSHGIVHRDIKPANVLLRSRSQEITLDQPLPADVEPILTDFGLVRLLDSTLHTTTGTVSGTPTYMSPEQARGERVEKYTDIYSLGIILYEMLAGTVPFQSDTTFGMLMKHINEPPPAIPGISPDIQALLDRALAKDPSFRYESAGEMANEFLAIFNGQTISPRTFQLAEMARRTTEDRLSPQKDTPRSSRGQWIRLAVEALAALVLIGVIYQYINTRNVNASEIPATPDPNVSVGRLKFEDFNAVMDQVALSLNNAELPSDGHHYEAWLIGEDQSTIQKLGVITFNAAGIGSVGLIDPNQKNLFQDYDKLVISEEADGSDVSQPTGTTVYSSVYPPETLTPARNLLASYSGTPETLALIQGLWYYSGSYNNISINGYNVPGDVTVGLAEAFRNGDEVTVRKRTEELINQIVGASSDQYLDYDQDGNIADETDGFGSFPNGQGHGYLQETSGQVQLAVDSPDSTGNIRTNGVNVQVCIDNMDSRLKRILELALELNTMQFGPEMEPLVTELESLGDTLVNGIDENENGLIEPIPGECGANSAYEFAYNMADMQIFPGKDRVPPTGK